MRRFFAGIRSLLVSGSIVSRGMRESSLDRYVGFGSGSMVAKSSKMGGRKLAGAYTVVVASWLCPYSVEILHISSELLSPVRGQWASKARWTILAHTPTSNPVKWLGWEISRGVVLVGKGSHATDIQLAAVLERQVALQEEALR